MKRTTIAFFSAVLFLFGIVGCNGTEDNSEAVSKMPTAKDSNNPDVPPISGKDMSMADDPKSMKGKGPKGGP